MDLAFWPPPETLLCSLSIPGLAFQRRCHPAVGRENQLAGLSLCGSSRVRLCLLGFAYLFIHLMCHFTRAVRVPGCLLKSSSPLRPGPCRKEPITAPRATECPRVTGSHHVCALGTCPAGLHLPSPCRRKVEEEGLPADGGEGEKPLQMNVDLDCRADEPRVAGGRARMEN